jgi:hypothetical protein
MIALQLQNRPSPEELPMHKPLLGALALSAALFAAPVWSADLHDGDIVISVVNGKLKASGGHDNLGKVFEGDFGDVAGGPYKTDDPGYDSEPGTFANHTIVNYMALGALKFWNGSSWSAAWVPSGVQVKVEGNLGEETFFGAAGVSGDASGLIGDAGATGSVHEHLDMSVVGDNRTVVGAYMISLKLSSTSIALQASDPYHIVLNRGLDEDAFEAAVMAVPEPSTYAMLLLGLAAVGYGAQRRRAR